MAGFDILTDKGLLRYETDPACLSWEDGTPVDLSRFALAYGGHYEESQIAFSPERPVVGKAQPDILKIQLGLGCNYSCSYCSQGGQQEDKSSSGDAAEFLVGLESWLHRPPAKIEFWGGEPLLYWKKIEALAPALRERFPDARMSLVTNGTLLTAEKARRLFDLGFTMSVSHDGPGQSLRGADPFDDPAWLSMMREVFTLFGERITFNVVITPLNYGLVDTLFWFEQRMGFPVKVNVEDVVTDYGGAKWAQADLEAMEGQVRKHVASGLALVFPRLRWAVLQFMQSLANRKPLTGSHQVCGMDRPDKLAVDLHGNVLTCQNAGAESGHRIGHVGDLGAVVLDTARSWAARPHCSECPVVHLCYGSCMFLESGDFESSCRSSFHYNRAVLAGAIHLLTGASVESVSGWKPARTFPIAVVAG